MKIQVAISVAVLLGAFMFTALVHADEPALRTPPNEIPFWHPHVYQERCEHLKENSPPRLRQMFEIIGLNVTGRMSEVNCEQQAVPMFLRLEYLTCRDVMQSYNVTGLRQYVADFGVQVTEPVDCNKFAQSMLAYARSPNATERAAPRRRRGERDAATSSDDDDY